MKNISFCLIVFFLGFHGFSQSKTINHSQTPKENTSVDSKVKSLNNGNSKPNSRVKNSINRKQTTRKENHEIIPIKE
ncbi:MAG: hypothetical protein RLZ10_2505 [Bacteroidota bacterium]|jgi:hypothetical protein